MQEEANNKHVGQNPVPIKKRTHIPGDQTPAPEKKRPFPAGLRVLAVDDNVVCLKVLERLLRQCDYEVTTTTKATNALEMLREKKENFDIVITDVKRLDMDGFQLLEIIGLEMEIPVIMMSANDDVDNVMKGVKHGARDYLVKPVRLNEVRNIWQHVIRKNAYDPNKLDSLTTSEEETIENTAPSHKRKDKDGHVIITTATPLDREDQLSSNNKKPRMVWTPELQQKFAAAIQHLGVDKAVPKKILDVMNEPGLSRENVASHLQKFRNLLKKQHEQQEKARMYQTRNDIHMASNMQAQSAALLYRTSSSGENGGSTLMLPWSQHNHVMPCNQIIRPPAMPLPRPPLSVAWMTSDPHHRQQTTAPEFNKMNKNYHHHRHHHPEIHPRSRVVDDDHMKIDHSQQSSRFLSGYDPCFGGAGQPHPSGLQVTAGLFPPYSSSSSSPLVFEHAANNNLQIHQDGLAQLAPVSQPDSLIGLVSTPSPGQHEGRRLGVSNNGKEGLNISRQNSGISLGLRGVVKDESMNMLLHHQFSNNLESEINSYYNGSNSPDDDLTTMVNEFGNNSAPRL